MNLLFATLPRRGFIHSVLAFLVLAAAPSLPAQQPVDQVQMWDKSFRQRTVQRGTIVQYDRARLLLRLASNRDVELPASQIASIRSAWQPEHRLADQARAAGKFAEAIALYRQALTKEERDWVRHRLVVQQVWCQQAQGHWSEAGETYLRVALASNPHTPYIAAMPLAWRTPLADPALEQRASSWLVDARQPRARLMGASWLLTSSRREEALGVLRELASGQDRDLAFLAEAQQWRLNWVNAPPATVTLWEEMIGRMPRDLRAGPYHVLGQALARLDQPLQARLAWMRVPIQYPDQFQLASESLLAAARSFAAARQKPQSDVLFRELVTSYDGTLAAQVARDQLTSPDP